MNETIQTIINYLIEAAALGVVVVIGRYVIPWLKQKGIYYYVEKFVQAAEQKADAGFITPEARKDDVIKSLQEIGVKITAEVMEYIETAVFNVNIEKASVEGIPATALEGVAILGETESEGVGIKDSGAAAAGQETGDVVEETDHPAEE